LACEAIDQLLELRPGQAEEMLVDRRKLAFL
jgi:hypothetical protein